MPFLRKLAKTLDTKVTSKFNFIGITGGVAVCIMLIVVVIDATGRKFSHPVYGAYELVSLLLSVLIFTSLVHCAIKKQHLVMNMVTNYFPAKIHSITLVITHATSAIVLWLLSWRLFVYGLELKGANSTGMEFTSVPIYPFVWLGAFCTLICGFIFLCQSITHIAKSREAKNESQKSTLEQPGV